MYSKTGKCPYHHTEGGDTAQSQRDSHVLIRKYVNDFHAGAMTALSLQDDYFAEKEQAVFAYRIFQLSQNKNFFPLLQEYANLITEDSASYKKYVDEMKKHLQGTGEKFFHKIETDTLIISRLIAGLETFNAFLKRVVIVSYSKGEKDFPYKLAVQLASTSLERANMIAQNPDIEGWKGLFFDPNTDISQMFLGVPVTRPVYKCPVLYSGEFRTIIDEYYKILCFLWDKSVDKPTDLTYF